VAQLQSQLKSLARQWDRLKASVFEEYTTETTEPGPGDAEDEAEMDYKKCSSCLSNLLLPGSGAEQTPDRCIPHHRPCIQAPAHPLYHTGSMRAKLFDAEIYLKNRVRSLLSEHLEAFMLMATQTDVV